MKLRQLLSLGLLTGGLAITDAVAQEQKVPTSDKNLLEVFSGNDGRVLRFDYKFNPKKVDDLSGYDKTTYDVISYYTVNEEVHFTKNVSSDTHDIDSIMALDPTKNPELKAALGTMMKEAKLISKNEPSSFVGEDGVAFKFKNNARESNAEKAAQTVSRLMSRKVN